jgi:hypothetical protein
MRAAFTGLSGIGTGEPMMRAGRCGRATKTATNGGGRERGWEWEHSDSRRLGYIEGRL